MAAVANWKQDQPVGKYFVFFLIPTVGLYKESQR
jgi:hypothetical protein